MSRDVMPQGLLTRRDLMKLGGTLAAGGLLLGLRLTRPARAADGADFAPNAFVATGLQGRITLILPHTEVGQGIITSSAMLIAEELEVGLDQVHVQPAPPDLNRYLGPLLYDQATGGSTSTRSDWRRLRDAGATARSMLVAAAAQRWGVSPAACRAERGTVRHEATARALAYGELVADAAGSPCRTGSC